MKRLGHLFLVLAFVAATMAANGGTGTAAFAQPLAQPIAVGGDFNHCDACGDKAAAAMACGTVCGSIMAVTPQIASMAPSARSIAWAWTNQVTKAANVEPEHTPPRICFFPDRRGRTDR